MAGAAALPAVQVHDIYDRVRAAIDEHAEDVDPDEHAALVTAVVLHFQHGVSIERAFRSVRVLVADPRRGCR